MMVFVTFVVYINIFSMRRRIVLAITGASGAIYAKVLLDSLMKMPDQIDKIGVIMSDNAKDVWKFELGNESYQDFAVEFYQKNDFMAPFASGSAQYDTMIICPCSMGTLGRIAHGISNDLTTRAADVILKESRKLILVARETPFNLIHLQNMTTIVQAGGVICPANPSFYSNPTTLEELAKTVTDRVLGLAGLQVDTYRWGE